MHAQSFSLAVKVLLFTAVSVLLLNFACANGAGVEILAFFGKVAIDQTHLKENVIRGVMMMQLIIKIVAIVGVSGFCALLFKGYRGWKQTRQV